MNGGPGASYPQFTGALIGVPSLPGTYAAGGQDVQSTAGALALPDKQIQVTVVEETLTPVEQVDLVSLLFVI